MIEAVPEDLTVKREILHKVSRTNRGAVIASNTSVIPIDALASSVDGGHRFVGTHWWNPAHLIRVVEVTPGAATDPATMDSVSAHLTAMGKVPVQLAMDVAGFIGNRLQVAMWREALELLRRGVCDAAIIDLVVRDTFGRRLPVVGPCENMQLIGLPLTAAIMGFLLPDLSNDREPTPLTNRDGEERLGALESLGDTHRGQVDRRLTEHLLALSTPPAG